MASSSAASACKTVTYKRLVGGIHYARIRSNHLDIGILLLDSRLEVREVVLHEVEEVEVRSAYSKAQTEVMGGNKLYFSNANT